MLARTVQSCLNGWSVCFGDAVARNAPLQLQLRRRSGQPCFFRSIPLSGLHARGAIALPPRQKKARLGPRASHSRAAWHLDPHAHAYVGARAMQPNTTQQHARAATRTGMAGDRRVCSLRGGRELPARAGLGINFGGDGGKLTPRAHAHAYADMRMPGRECKALELNPPRALLLARRKCDGLAHAQPRRGRAAHAKTQRRPELPADLRLQGGVYMCAPLHHRNKPTIHSIMIVLSSPACIRAIMNAFMFHIGAA